MDARQFIYRLIDYFPGPLRSAARWVADIIFGVWDDISGVLRRARPEWLRLDEGIRWFYQNVLNWCTSVINVIRWIVRDWGPRVIATVYNTLTAWVQAGLNTLVSWVQSGLAQLVDWVTRGINAVVDRIQAVARWAYDRFAEIWDPLWTTIRRVAALLFDPVHLAEWAIGAIWSAFWRFADGHVESIVEWVWARRQAVIGKTLGRLEALLARIL